MKSILTSLFIVASFMSAIATNNYLQIPDIAIAPGETKTLVINLNNETALSAMQMDLIIPEGISISEDEYGDPDIYFASGRAVDHGISCNYRNATTLAILAYSPKSRNFKGNSGALIEMTVTASSTFSGNHPITAANVLFSTSAGEEIEFADATGYIICNIPAKSIDLDAAEITLIAGETHKLTATVYPDNATDKSVSWDSANTKVAMVDDTGLITAVSVGTTTITATCGSLIATCSVIVKDLEQCAAPVLTIEYGRIKAYCETPRARIHTTVVAEDHKTFHHVNDETLQLTGIYNITSYAEADGMTDSNEVKYMLAWVKDYDNSADVEAFLSGSDRPIAITSNGINFTIVGTQPGEPIELYDMNGIEVYIGEAETTSFTIPAECRPNTIYIIVIGQTSIKALL